MKHGFTKENWYHTEPVWVSVQVTSNKGKKRSIYVLKVKRFFLKEKEADKKQKMSMT